MAQLDKLKQAIDDGHTAGLYPGNGRMNYHLHIQNEEYLLILINSDGSPEKNETFTQWEDIFQRQPTWPVQSDQWELL